MQILEYFQDMFVLASNGEVQGVFFYAAVYAFLVLTYSLVFQLRIASWPSVVGELIDGRISEFGKENAPVERDYKVAVSYNYRVGNKEYSGKRLSPWVFVTNNNAAFILKSQLNKITESADGGVTVYYNPRKPRKSFLIKPGLIGKIITGLLAVIPLLLYVTRFHG